MEPWIAKNPEYLTSIYSRMHALIQGTHGYNIFLNDIILNDIILILKVYILVNSETKQHTVLL